MGREIKRVALDLDWQLNKVWKGYVSPDWRDCPEGCKGGYSKAYRLMEEAVNRLMWNRDGMKNADYCKVTTFLAGREPAAPFGHDSMDAWAAVKKLGEMAGLPDDWHTCPVCHGHGNHPDDQDAIDAWKATEPPVGEGWQVWETVSEGSPISPVFVTAIECAAWVEKNEHCSLDAAMKFVNDGWAPSMIMDGKGLRSGIQALD